MRQVLRARDAISGTRTLTALPITDALSLSTGEVVKQHRQLHADGGRSG